MSTKRFDIDVDEIGLLRLDPLPDGKFLRAADVAAVLREAYEKFPLESQPLPVVSWIAERLDITLEAETR